MASRAFFNPTFASIARRGVRFASVHVAPGENAFVAGRAAVHEHAKGKFCCTRNSLHMHPHPSVSVHITKQFNLPYTPLYFPTL